VREQLRVVVRARRTNTYGLNVVLGALDAAGPGHGWSARVVETDAALAGAVGEALRAADRVLVCWSFYSPDVATVADELREIRATVPDPDHRITHLAGGVHAMAEPAATLGLGFDLVATGEGEQIAVDVVAALVDGHPLADVAGLAWLDGDGALVRTAPATRHPLDTFPPFAAQRRRYNPIEITRGCIYACRFCQTPYAFKATFRHRSVEAVADAVTHLRSRGMHYVRFLTPTSLSYGATGETPDLGALEALLAACRHAIGPDGKLYFGTFPSEVRPEHVTDETMALITRFCDNRSVQIGAQSGSEAVLASSKRGHDVDAVERAVRIALAHGLRPDVDLLFGLPGETDADARASLALAERLGSLGARMHGHTFLPLPGTPYRSAAPGAVSDAVRLDLERLAARGALYGQWARQERLAVTLAASRPRRHDRPDTTRA
jgi:B12-binding domain/radical SAM domain protein